ncbi:unnamed protein product [Brassicogethes aeneus]|uniref:BED-type domain-containing protein n=1 Tax=Brassicogethes aeneus TaxID=1431903 RepID=A0A9P0BH62_BRAAE|nr:unnamed protein product [Brassicogethes aeneus]
MSSRKKSEVWNHFELNEGNNKAKCNYCSALISKESTGNFTRHIRSKHIGIPINREKNTEVHTKSDLQTLNIENDKLEPSQYQPEQSKKNSLKRQNKIDSWTIKPVPISKSKQFDDQLMRMIVKEYHPFSIVEDPQFKKFTKMICPDSWTSITNDNYTAITEHWIIEKETTLMLSSNLLECISYNERHTAENLCALLQTKFEECEIENKIVTVVSDNAANIVASIRKGNWRHVGCFAHTVNLIVQKGLQEIAPIIFKIKKVVEYFKRSSHALAKFNQIQEQMGLVNLKLKMDVSTRWNSTLDMISRFCQRKDAIISTLAILQQELTLSAIDWEVAANAVTILQIFNDVTVEISAEQNIAASKIYLFINSKENEIRQSSYALGSSFKKNGFADSNKANNAIEILKAKVKNQKVHDLRLIALEKENQIDRVPHEEQPSSSSILWKTFDERAAIIEVDIY